MNPGSSIGPTSQPSYSTDISNSGNTPDAKGAAHVPGGLDELITPEEVETAARFESSVESAKYIAKLVEQRSAAVKERSRREALFHPGDVLARR